MSRFDELKFRQVHLDFHTSEHIPNVGKSFDKEQFKECLRKGHVNSITIFALCHHGWCYYDTQAGSRHPQLEVDLLPLMLEACREEGVDAPVYLTVGWNDLIGREHPEWIARDRNGALYNLEELDPCADNDTPRPWGWPRICMNTPYLDYLLSITGEVMEKFNPEGIFYDITGENECYCDACRKSMSEKNIDMDNPVAVKQFGREVYINSLEKFSSLIWGLNPETRIYHNSKNQKGRDDLYKHFSHYEVESLPTGFWGYNHFPHNAKYFFSKKIDFLGMTGKFHTAWGEFGGYKNPFALKYECARILTFGGKCCIGDQMHPSGMMDEDTYRIIGEAYSYAENREHWCSNLESVADIGVLCPSAVAKNTGLDCSDRGAAMVLGEKQYLFDMLDENMDFGKYKLLILPDRVPVNNELKSKIDSFLANGGCMIISGKSGLDPEETAFQFDIGAEFNGKSTWDIDYTKVEDKKISQNMVSMPFLNYDSAYNVKREDAEILAGTIAPYFNRTYGHFCSHRNSPPSGNDAGYPSVLRKGNIVYFAHEIFAMYAEMGKKLHRDLITNCIDLLLQDKTLSIDIPSCGTVTLYRNSIENHFVLHVLYAVPVKRGEVQVIEDIVPIRDISVSFKSHNIIKSIRLIPENRELEFTQQNNTVHFQIPQLKMHQMVEIK